MRLWAECHKKFFTLLVLVGFRCWNAVSQRCQVVCLGGKRLNRSHPELNQPVIQTGFYSGSGYCSRPVL